MNRLTFILAAWVANFNTQVGGLFGREEAQEIAKKNAYYAEGNGWHVVAERRHAEAAISPQLGFSMLTP